ncbi:uncharacterized protein LOC134534252 [Bacillus rossius redtenbacheri]|uniref:uncharacterized protein LOC134534252 n=1 Tax=Bacillus rossius redtenbacheri TaxID=93214 RepID=UPI002FDEFCC0
MCDAQVSSVLKDCSNDIFSSQYFKSSFAKSMVVELTDKSSLSCGKVLNKTIGGSNALYSDVQQLRKNRYFSLTTSSYRSLDRDLIRQRTDFKGKNHLFHEQEIDSKAESREHSQPPQPAMGETSPLRRIDTVVLQSRVDTLQWQLKQAEESRQMYRSVMEHVMMFLERVYTNLDEMSRTEQCESLPASVCNSPSHRVPRSLSALSVDASSRRVARGRRETAPSVPKAISTAQIEQSPSTFCDYTWRRSAKVTQQGDVTTQQKLSQDAYRLLRTVQSLLNTNEPNLAQNTGPGDSCSKNLRCSSRNDDDDSPRLTPDASSVRDSLQDLSMSRISPAGKTPKRDRKDGFSSLRREHARRRLPLDSTLTLPRDSPPPSPGTSPESPRSTASLGRPRKLKETRWAAPPAECYVSDVPSEKQLSLSSNEDESGFSSMSSFQEVGLPPVPPSPTPSPDPPVGLPVLERADCSVNHRRWSSVPVDPRLGPVIPDSVTVMWV